MNDSSLSPTMASVLYLRLAEYAALPAAEQARLRSLLVACASRALQGLNLPDRLVLNASDGLIVVVLDHPEGALDAAGRCLENAVGLPLQLGLDHGPTLPVAQGGTVVGMVGDSIIAAGTAAAYSPLGEVRITQAFRDALAARTPSRSALLVKAGALPGESGRMELYTPGPRTPAQRRRGLLSIAAVSALGLVALALAGRQLNLKPPVLEFDIKPSGQVSIDGERVGASPPLTQLELKPGSHRIVVRYADQEPLRQTVQLEHGQRLRISHDFAPPAVLMFDIQPGGEVFVDGVSQGQIPGLEQLQLAAGDHLLEVKYLTYPPLSVTISPKPAQHLRVRYTFEGPPPAPPPSPKAKKKGKR
ncbi:PEGA domain-containing protein [Solimonas sp. K1W22B-7]|uniref:PEGA domain-containing protein n=1 Tax=Solimonas sp. K1W22B-7 TaxID=2303331 RepID=UPI000E32F0C8|nr:PEGA domain-containing protein [Solimonas sp. K1W22B-7]AXQ30901.1 PEGA domain-containing protein [Solimonas sp. K1W22B-7]